MILEGKYLLFVMINHKNESQNKDYKIQRLKNLKITIVGPSVQLFLYRGEKMLSGLQKVCWLNNKIKLSDKKGISKV